MARGRIIGIGIGGPGGGPTGVRVRELPLRLDKLLGQGVLA
ncbi:hypothetical protein [Ramlibacter agri]|nr:hypothetical protein [Ramlibacter agri]